MELKKKILGRKIVVGTVQWWPILTWKNVSFSMIFLFYPAGAMLKHSLKQDLRITAKILEKWNIGVFNGRTENISCQFFSRTHFNSLEKKKN